MQYKLLWIKSQYNYYNAIIIIEPQLVNSEYSFIPYTNQSCTNF